MPKSFNDLAEQAKRVFLEQPVHVDKLFNESGPMSAYLAAWTVVEGMSKREILYVVSEAVDADKPLPSSAGRFNQASWTSLLTDALIADLQGKLHEDDAIRAKEQERMKDR